MDDAEPEIADRLVGNALTKEVEGVTCARDEALALLATRRKRCDLHAERVEKPLRVHRRIAPVRDDSNTHASDTATQRGSLQG